MLHPKATNNWANNNQYFSRAFDSISHDKLFQRLHAYGIRGSVLSWLKNYFSNRTHQTRVGQYLSTVADLLSGVVQGSGIGPVTFLPRDAP